MREGLSKEPRLISYKMAPSAQLVVDMKVCFYMIVNRMGEKNYLFKILNKFRANKSCSGAKSDFTDTKSVYIITSYILKPWQFCGSY